MVIVRFGIFIFVFVFIFNFYYVDGENLVVLEMWEFFFLVDLIVMNVGLVIC